MMVALCCHWRFVMLVLPHSASLLITFFAQSERDSLLEKVRSLQSNLDNSYK